MNLWRQKPTNVKKHQIPENQFKPGNKKNEILKKYAIPRKNRHKVRNVKIEKKLKKVQ